MCGFDPSNIATQGPLCLRLSHPWAAHARLFQWLGPEVGYARGRAKREIRIECLELLDEPFHYGCAHGVAQAGRVAEGSSGRDTSRWSEVFFTTVSARGVSGHEGFSGCPGRPPVAKREWRVPSPHGCRDTSLQPQRAKCLLKENELIIGCSLRWGMFW
ncbi:hypothetical protein EDB89DRAFT_1905812 [Lactarius sanguifluus]|nr:hypothetical protein EDB89DRAFT_1905812 [Lactarius sanguifluus]